MNQHKSQLPTVELVDNGNSNEKIYKHPSFGLIQRSVVTGNPTLFGSTVVDRSYIEVIISTAELQKRIGTDHYKPNQRQMVLKMSHAQWANFISTANAGHTPVTIYAKNNGELENLPGIEGSYDLSHQIEEDTKGVVDSAVHELTEVIDKLTSELSKTGSPSKVAIKDIIHQLTNVKSNLPNNLEYCVSAAIKKVREASEQIALNTKVDIDLYAQQAGFSSEQRQAIEYKGLIPFVSKAD